MNKRKICTPAAIKLAKIKPNISNRTGDISLGATNSRTQIRTRCRPVKLLFSGFIILI